MGVDQLQATPQWEGSHEKVTSLARMLSVLDLFTEKNPVWSADRASQALGFTRSAVYRYMRELADSGLIASIATGQYSLGPRIIQLNRQLTESDPMLIAMERIESTLPQFASKQKWHLCRLFKDRVIPIGEYGHLDQDLSYKRGLPMPLLRGATSTAVLAWLPERQLMRLYLENQEQASTLGASWPDYKKTLAEIRRKGFAFAQAEIDPHVFAIAAPIFNSDDKVAGSISNVRSLDDFDPDRLDIEGRALVELAQRICADMKVIANDQFHHP